LLFIKDNKGTSKDILEQYNSDYFREKLKDNMSGYMSYEKQSWPLRMNFRNILSHISSYQSLDSTKWMLDIGCAYGFLLDEAKKLGVNVHGVDLSRSAIQWMQENLYIQGTVGLACDAPEGPFDLITAIEVIEHVNDPHSFLDDIYIRLKKGGILAIATGANDTLIARFLGKRWWYLNPPDHCSIFSRFALKKLIAGKGFNILEHNLIPYHWVGLNNLLLKVARVFQSRKLGSLASLLPSIAIPVLHFSAQLIIAQKD
jgi:SAM-dependent methyltransferase